MRRMKNYGESIFLIGLGIFAIFTFRNPKNLNPENTNKIEGILSEYPSIGTHGESNDYIGFRICGYNDFYEFSDCSLDNQIEEKVKKLTPGDKVLFFTEKGSSVTTYPWESTKYKSYRICEAYSPKYGYFINFHQYNKCNKFKLNTFLPILGLLLILIGIFQFYKKLLRTRLI
jgi:hypothetical protein